MPTPLLASVDPFVVTSTDRAFVRRAELARAVPIVTLRATYTPAPPSWWRYDAASDQLAWPVVGGFALEVRAVWPLDGSSGGVR